MSEKSFAVASVSVAIIWGTFFYPPSAQSHRVEANTAVAGIASPRPVDPQIPQVALNTGPRTVALNHGCALDVANATRTCAPLHKLAGE
jgi:hypothetical protein